MTDVLQKNFQGLLALLTEILDLKIFQPGLDITDKRNQGALLFVLLKRINRTVKHNIRSGREDLHNKKLDTDSKRLQLQNLLYEINHLKRDISNCYRFKSRDEDINLLTEEEYMKLAPYNEMSIDGQTQQLVLLQLELNTRKQLSARRKELFASKDQVLDEIMQKTNRINSLAPSMRVLLKATKPLQDALQIPILNEWKTGKLVQLLPPPLHLLYMNMHALEMKREPAIRLEIFGTEKDVRQMEVANEVINLKKPKEFLACSVGSQVSDELREHIFDRHALSIQICIGIAENREEAIALNVRYFPHLGFVTAFPYVDFSDDIGDLSLLYECVHHLFPNDCGDTIPTTEAEHKLNKINMTASECIQTLKDDNLGRPYYWLQELCGISVNKAKNKCVDVKIQNSTSEVIKGLYNFWLSRLNLMKQISSLVNKNIWLYLKNEKLPVTPPSCSLVQWTSVTWEEYLAHCSTEEYIKLELVSPSDVFYRAVVVRGSAKMECLISVPRDFPDCSPVWVISIFWNGLHCGSNNSATKNLESLTNSIQQADLKDEMALLSYQLVSTMHRFDIFLETEGPLYNPMEYSTEKHFVKSFKDRQRSRPYNYIEGTVNSFN